jgi:hypothetical protein
MEKEQSTKKLPPKELWDKWVKTAQETFACCDDGCQMCHMDQSMYMQTQLQEYQNQK